MTAERSSRRTEAAFEDRAASRVIYAGAEAGECIKVEVPLCVTEQHACLAFDPRDLVSRADFTSHARIVEARRSRARKSGTPLTRCQN